MIRTRAFQRRKEQAHAIRRRFARAKVAFIKYGGKETAKGSVYNWAYHRLFNERKAFYANDWHFQKQLKERRDAFMLQSQ